MKTILLYLILVLAAVILLSNCQFEKKGKRNAIEIQLAPPPAPKPNIRLFKGTIGKEAVAAKMVNIEGEFAGGYYYLTDSVEHKLSGNSGKEGIVTYELDGKGGKIAMMKGKAEGKGNIVGTKTTMDGSISLPVTLTLVSDSTIYQPK